MSAVAEQFAPPDLLRRFAATEFEEPIMAAGCPWVVRTNDPALISALREAAPKVGLSGEQKATLVRDHEIAAVQHELTIVDSGTVVVGSMGEVCFVGYDRELGTLVGFFAAGLPGEAVEVALSGVLGCVVEGMEPGSRG